jgi:hypothetical protein
VQRRAEAEEERRLAAEAAAQLPAEAARLPEAAPGPVQVQVWA